MGVRTRTLRLLVVLSALGLLLLSLCGPALASPSSPSAAGGCTNEARREEQNVAYLPNCRAFEMVSPLDKKDADVNPKGSNVAAMNGQSVAYGAAAGFGQTAGSGAEGFTQYVASRSTDGHWSSHGVTPPSAQDAFQFTIGATALATFSEDLSHAVVEGYDLPGATGGIPKGVNLYEEATGNLALETITQDVVKEPIFPLYTWGTLQGYAGDLSTVTFETFADLLPQTTGFEEKLYIWDRGALTVATLPDGKLPPGGSVAPRRRGRFEAIENIGTVSANGSAAAFSALGNRQLYLWRRGTDSAWVSESEASTPDPEPQNVKFQAMTPDGRHVLFTSSDRLTDADPGGEGVGLYVYTDSASPESESNLAFVARVPDARGSINGFPAVVAGVSDDAKRIYFYGGLEGKTAGIYLWDEGAVRFVAAAPPLGHFGDFNYLANGAGQASADGRELAFVTSRELTGQHTGGYTQLYVYDETRESLTCVSCPKTGVPTASVELEPTQSLGFGLNLEVGIRVIARNGRYVIFNTREALVARDTNTVPDAYQYDTQTQTVSLLSPGTQAEPAWAASMDESGENVFVVTQSPLVRSDTDTLLDLYDVRVNGGVPQPAPETGPCIGDECQGTPSAAPTFNTASGFTGLGNVVPHTAKTTPKALTRAQRLARALGACRNKPKKARRRCVVRAKRKYGPRRARKAGNDTSSTVRR